MNEKELENLSETTIDKYRKYVNPAYANILAFGGFSVPEDRAEGVYVYDKSGRKFLDCVGGYGAFSLGHLNPNVVKAEIMGSMNKDNYIGRTLSEIFDIEFDIEHAIQIKDKKDGLMIPAFYPKDNRRIVYIGCL